MARTPIKKLYGQLAKEEWRRLVKDPFHRLELDTSLHFLKKYLPKNGLILDAGGGPGRYTIELAKMGHDLVLLDYTPELLEVARKKISRFGVKNKVKEVIEESITDLSRFADNSFDAVICLGGPLSHVRGEKNRQKAVSELMRVAKKSGYIFVGVMGKFGVLIDSLKYWPQEVALKNHFRNLWRKGEDDMWHGVSYCHFFTADEIKNLLSACGGTILECVGLEGLAHDKNAVVASFRKYPQVWQNWLESHFELCTDPAVFATSGHMLLIAKKSGMVKRSINSPSKYSKGKPLMINDSTYKRKPDKKR